MLIGINELDNVLRERVIRIRILRKRREEVVEHDTESDSVMTTQKKLRDDLYIFGLTCGKSIASLYREHFNDIRGLESLANREADLWAPIMAIANLVDADGTTITEMMRVLSAQCKAERVEDDQEDSQMMVVASALNHMIEEARAVGGEADCPLFDSDTAYRFIMRACGFEGSISKTKLTQMVMRVGVKVKIAKVNGVTKRCYQVPLAALHDFSNRYPVDTQTVTVTASVTEHTAVS